MDDQGGLHVLAEHTPEVRFHEPELGGEKVPATTVRDHPSRPWRVVEESPAAPSAHPEPEPPPRSVDELRTARDELAKKLVVYREDLTPDKLADTIAAMQLDNALRAAQIEGMADFIDTSDGIASFYDLNDALQQLGHRLGLEPNELNPRSMAEALADPGLRNVRRLQAVQDLVEYAAHVRDVDEAASLAARDRLAERLGVAPESLFADKYDKKADVFRPDSASIEPASLLRAINDMMHRSNERPELLAALTEYAQSLSRIDPFHTDLRFDPATDPRVAEGELPIRDTAVPAQLRGFRHELIGEPPRSDDPSRAGAVWARLQGLELGDDPARLAKAYEAYRDGKIEKFERPTDDDTRTAVEELRAETRARAADIEALRKLAEEYNAVTAPAGPDPAPPRPRAAAIELDGARTDFERAGRARDYALSRITHPDAHEPHLEGAPGRRIGPSDLTPQRLASTLEHLRQLPVPEGGRPGHETRIAELAAAVEHYNTAQTRVRAAEHDLNRALMASARPGETPLDTLHRELEQALGGRERAMRGVRVEAADLTPERFRDALDEAAQYARTPEEHAAIGERIQRLHDAAVRVHQIQELIAGHEFAAAAEARAAESPLDAARRESTAAQRELRAAQADRDALMTAPEPHGAEEFAAHDAALRAAVDRVDQARAAADRWSTELKRLWAAETRAAVTPHEAAAQARSDAHAALRQAITDFHAATRVRVAESDLTPARLDSTLEELQGKTVLANGPGSATAFEDLRRAAEHSHRADALAHWVEDNIPHPHAPASTPPPPGHEGEDPIGGTPAKPTDPTQPNSDPSAHPVPVPESHPKSDPNDPDTWFDRMQAEQADWSAQMEAKRAQWLHDIADRMEPGSTEERFARLRAENADRLARIAADRADWFWDQAGGRPDTPEPDAPTPGPDGPDSGGGPRPDAGFNDGAAQPKPDPDPGTAEGGRAPVARHESQPPTGPTEAEHVAGAEAHPAEPAPEPPRGEAGEPVGGKTPAVGQPESPSNDGGTESGQGGAGDPGAPRSEQKAVDDENASGGRGSPPKAAEDTGYGPTPSGENEATATGATSAGKAAANGEETRADGAGAHAGGDEAGARGKEVSEGSSSGPVVRDSERSGPDWRHVRSHLPKVPQQFDPQFPQYTPQPSQQAAPWALPPDANPQPPAPPNPPPPPNPPAPPYPPQPPYSQGTPAGPGGSGAPSYPGGPAGAGGAIPGRPQLPEIPQLPEVPQPPAMPPGGAYPGAPTPPGGWPNGQQPPWGSWPGAPAQPGGSPQWPDGFQQWADGLPQWANGTQQWERDSQQWLDGTQQRPDGSQRWPDGSQQWTDGNQQSANGSQHTSNGNPHSPGAQYPHHPGSPSMPGQQPHGPHVPGGHGGPSGGGPRGPLGVPGWNGLPDSMFGGEVANGGGASGDGGDGGGANGTPQGGPPAGPAGGSGGQQQGGTGGGQVRGGNRFPRASGPVSSGSGVYLRSHSGFGEFAMLNPATGELNSAPVGAGSLSGVYDDMDGLRVAFYRDQQAGLVLRVGDQAIELDRLGADAHWERTQHGFNRLLVGVGGTPQVEVRYRTVPQDADLGLLVRDVLSDPARRAGIFG